MKTIGYEILYFDNIKCQHTSEPTEKWSIYKILEDGDKKYQLLMYSKWESYICKPNITRSEYEHVGCEIPITEKEIEHILFFAKL